LDHESLSGPVNLCAPNPVRNAELTETLGDVLGRPTVFFVPRLGVRLLFGQMGEELLLASERVRPAKLADAGFEWEYEKLEPALKHALRG
jgi:NAD dependent epimerase/dehydratase family enzyme